MEEEKNLEQLQAELRQAQDELMAKLREYAAGATLIIVAQRIGTIRNADRIIVLENGCIVGNGNHAELMKTCDVYREIALSQMSDTEASAV